MATQIFVNLPVKNLDKSIEFFTKLGFTFNPQFTDRTATWMIVAENIFVMLLTEEKFKTFTPKQICDATKGTEVLVCLSIDSREKVDEMVRKAVAAGGSTLQRTTRPRLYVWAWVSGFGWSHLGIDPHGMKRNRSGLKMQ